MTVQGLDLSFRFNPFFILYFVRRNKYEKNRKNKNGKSSS